MTYVFDTNSFIVLGHYFPERFPSFWERFDELVSNGDIASVREVRRELDHRAARQHLVDWIAGHKRIFVLPSPEETEFVRDIFAVAHFQQLVGRKQRLKGSPVADPFVIAAAKMRGACVVTEEVKKMNAARIPNVCEHFQIDCTNLEGMMEREGWMF